MTALSQDVATELGARIAELEQQLQSVAADKARLQHELSTARERQRAGAEILSAIASTSGDDERALRQIAETSVRLFDATSVTLRILSADSWSRTIAVGPGAERIVSNVNASQLKVGGKNFPGTVVAENRQIHFPDIFDVDARYADFPGLLHARAAGTRVMAGTPLRRDGKAIGTLILHRERPEPFSTEELALQQSFADQAVIAIDNARLFNETQQALARQTATADILRVISQSPTDVQPVFDAIVQTVVRLVGCETAFIQRCDGQHFWSVARCRREEGLMTVINPRHAPIDPSANFPSRAIVARATLHLPDWSQIELPDFERRIQEQLGYQSAVYLPLLRDGECIGVLGLAGSRPNLFGETEISLAEAFRDQALIAIENTRLFNETQAALERQTATADILKVIAGSPTDTQPVFDAIAESARRVIGGHSAIVTRVVGDHLHLAALTAGSEAGREKLTSTYPQPITSSIMSAQVARTGEVLFYTDTERDADGITREFARARGYRSVLAVPMLRDGTVIGTINVTRVEPGPFDGNTIGLLKTFADQAVIAIENARLFNETKEALERQTATADILKVIASSPSDVQPVFAAIAASSNQLLGGFSTAVFRFIDDAAHLAAFTPVNPTADALLQNGFPRPTDDFTPFALALRGQVAQIPDTETTAEPEIKDVARARGYRAMLFTPLMSSGAPIGLISVTRIEPGAFADQHVQLLRTFADQAVIAIENVRLFEQVQARTRDLTEALQQQTATADALKVISRSAFDLDSVMNTLTHSAAELCKAELNALYLREGDVLVARGIADADPAQADFLRRTPLRVDSSSYVGRTLLAGAIRNIGDVESENEIGPLKRFSEALDFKSILFVPLMREGRGIGVFALARKRKERFSQREVELVQTFADQAVIAIENVRLFDEVQARTRELTEALERQTATSEVLSVISRSPSDLQPVLETISETAARLVGSEQTMFFRFDGEVFRILASWNFPPEVHDMLERRPLRPGHPSAIGRAGASLKPVCIPDVLEDPHYGLTGEQNRARYRTTLGVPLVRDGRLIGAFSLNRSEPNSFTDKHIELVSMFADQAVIALENTRLFDEVQAKTREVTEALQRQTATADVLRIISRSVAHTAPVFDAILDSCQRLFNPYDTAVYLVEGDRVRGAARRGPGAGDWGADSMPLEGSSTGLAIAQRRPLHFPDLADKPDLPEDKRVAVKDAGGMTVLYAPMISQDSGVGSLVITRRPKDPFSEAEIALIQLFADQAVIAIENARLFDEVQAKTRDLTEALTYQTGSANILKVIASSPTDVEPALKAIVESACELCDAYDAAVVLRDGDDLRFSAHHGPIPIGIEKWPINRRWTAGRAFIDQTPVHIDDLRDEKHADFPDGRELAIRMGHRTILSVPLLRENESIGAIVLRRKEVHPFTEKQITLLKTFADQAVIAIGNVHLFEEVQARTRELTQSLDELRTAQDRLVQTEKLASLGQLTAGIAHEIKNPLNFVNNFAALSAELTDELNEVLASASVTEKIRDEVDELTGLLKDNLQKIVQHGKRADSIVKNMLLHSREGSGEHRPTDVNALVEESLNLAYHGARAEKPHFNVTLRRELDPAAGMAELFPQEITRVLLNLITNGFYAVAKRGGENGAAFEPVLSASTRDRGAHIEIRIRDNGTGIPPDVKEKMFNPFFTTKPAGEGTGLGLSMSHDIIVKQHGGTIDVATAPGEFTEFTILLPRNSSFSDKNRG